LVGASDAQTDSAPGRFYFWGARALYLGPGLPATVHAHHAVQVCIPLSGTVRLRTGPSARWREYEGAVIPSDQIHESDRAVPLIATFWLEPDTGDAGRFVEPQADSPIARLPRAKLDAIVPTLLDGWRDRYPSQRAEALMEEVVQLLAPGERASPVIDHRVARAMEMRASSLAATAAAVALSPSRLGHLFTPAVGIPRRRYVLWLRLRDALQELAAGASITHAAHAADFADGAHLTRTFRRMLGFTPSAALHVGQFVQDASTRRG
jgi:AraC-like DNA-binding protein